MAKEEPIKTDGTIVEMVRGAFRVKVDDTEHVVLCKVAGKLRRHFIKVTLGDKVSIEMSPFDLTKGRIVYRSR